VQLTFTFHSLADYNNGKQNKTSKNQSTSMHSYNTSHNASMEVFSSAK